jgi:Domain of unknown function (DUF4403)
LTKIKDMVEYLPRAGLRRSGSFIAPTCLIGARLVGAERMMISRDVFANPLPPILGLLLCASLSWPALGAGKPVLNPDEAAPATTPSHVSATIEFSLRALAEAIDRDVPKRLATINDRISCVHRRLLGFEVNAKCDVRGYVERTGSVSLYGEEDRVIGAVPIYGTVSGQGSNKITSHIHGNTEARITVEAQARPQLRRDWSVDLHFSDTFHWTQPPVLLVLGHEISLARFVEPKINLQLDRLRAKANAAARALDLRTKAETAWHHAFEPIKLADDPEVWLQMSPQSAAFAGVHANKEVMDGSLEIQGMAETFVGHAPTPVAATPLPPLGTEVSAPGKFEVIIPVHIDYETLRQKAQAAIAAFGAKGDTALRTVEIYPSSGKIIVGLRFAKSSDTDPNSGEWVYLLGTPHVDNDSQSLSVQDLTINAPDGAPSDTVKWLIDSKLIAMLRQQLNVSYKEAYEKMIAAADAKLTRPLGNGFRMEGQLSAARVDKILLLADGLSVQLRANGALKILYGL